MAAHGQDKLLYTDLEDGDPQLSPVAEEEGLATHTTEAFAGQGEPTLDSYAHIEASEPLPRGDDLTSHRFHDAEGRFGEGSHFGDTGSEGAAQEPQQHMRPARGTRVPVASTLSMLKVPPKIIDRFVNLLVLGESGLGKTTFIKNCFSDLSQEPFQLRDASGASMQEFRDDPDTFCTRLPPITVPEALIRLHYSVQDVPGYGDDMAFENSDAYIAEVLELVSKQNVRQCLETQGILLDELEFRHMFDACLYFISPHQLKPVDLKFMAAISAEVPVIPIIAKADCMTPEEREDFRERIINALKKPSLPNQAGPIEVFKFPDEVMVAAEALGLAPPFAVMASNTLEMVEGQLCPVRHYSWGTCMPLMKEHSDAYFFRKTVLEYGFHALRDEKKRRYVVFRDSFQAADSFQATTALPASSQSPFSGAAPGLGTAQSGGLGNQRPGHQGSGVLSTHNTYASMGSATSFPQGGSGGGGGVMSSPADGYGSQTPVPATPRYPDTRPDLHEEHGSSGAGGANGAGNAAGPVPKRALSKYFQGMRKNSSGMPSPRHHNTDY